MKSARPSHPASEPSGPGNTPDAEKILSHSAKLCGIALMTCYSAKLLREESRVLRAARYARPLAPAVPPSSS